MMPERASCPKSSKLDLACFRESICIEIIPRQVGQFGLAMDASTRALSSIVPHAGDCAPSGPQCIMPLTITTKAFYTRYRMQARSNPL